MFKLVIVAALLAFAAAKPTTLLTSSAIATAPLASPLAAPLTYTSYYGSPLAYSSGLAYNGYLPAYYRGGLPAAPIAYTDYAPLAYI